MKDQQPMKKAPIPPMIKHAEHEVEIQLIEGSKHYAKYHCKTCNKFVAWVSKEDVSRAHSLGIFEYDR